MSNQDLVRPSRDGDQFHYHWAARQCLALLPGSSNLVAVSIEGPSNLGRKASFEDGDELIDVGLYYGSEELEDALLVHYIQLKHSTKHAHEFWTASGLAKTLEGFTKRYTKLLQKFPATQLKQKVKFSFTTNRPIDQKVLETLEDLASARAPRHRKIHTTLLGYTNLSGQEVADFFQIFYVDGREPDLWMQRNLLTQDINIYLAEADYDIPVQLKELVSRKATSEFANDPVIRRHDVLRVLKTTEIDLLPAPCLITEPSETLPREQEVEIRDALLASKHPIVLHADGGVGKSILALKLANSMPTGSIAVLYDCFGDGLYRNALHFRHRHCDALPQIANEIAAHGLCHPLIPSAGTDAKHFMHAFCGRLKQAIGSLRAENTQASLCLIIDAADNADMAAEEQGEASFIPDLIRTPLPDGVRLIFTCRTHRQIRLNPPPESNSIELRQFSLTETTNHLRRFYPQATDAEAAEFGFLSSSNPRVQALALNRKRTIDQMLKELGPTPSTVDRAIGELLQHAINKLKDEVGHVESEQIDLICQALAVLRPLVPISVLAQISGTPESAVRSFAFDLGRPLLVKGGSLHFLDEPAETWFREKFRPSPENLAKFLQRLRPLASSSSYVASTLPQLLLTAGLMDELIELALSEDALPTSNALERRDVEIQRLTFALKACLQRGEYAAAAKLALKTGGEAAGEARQSRLIQDNTDIAAALLAPDRINEIVSRRTFSANWMGAHHAYDAGLLSGCSEFLPEARSRLRMALAWLHAWARQPAKERENERVDDADRAEIAMAHLLALGPREATKFLSSWKPLQIVFPASKRLARRLLDLGRYEEVDSLATYGAKNIWLMLGLVAEASRVGHVLPAEPLAKLMRVLVTKHAQLNKVTQWESRWDLLDAVTATILVALRVLPHENTVWAKTLRCYLPETPPSDFADRFGSHRSLSLLLRAYALEAALRGEELTLIAVAPPDIRKNLERNSSYNRNSETVAFELSTGGALPWFVLGAEIACGRTPSNLSKAIEDALKVTASTVSQDYHKQFNLEQVAAIEWTRALRDSSTTYDISISALRAWLDSKHNILWHSTLTSMCRIAARTKNLSEFALEIAVAVFHSLDQSREDADSRSDSYQRLARAVFPVSRSEAAAYFNQAVEISSRIGEENLDRWFALLCLAEAGADSGHPRPKSAYRLSRAAELTYEYVARDKHFDWERTVHALVGLCAPSALAILSRWRDRDFGDSDRLIRIIVYNLVQTEQLPSLAPVALAALNAEWNHLDDIKRAIEAESNVDQQRLVLRLGYRHMRIIPHAENSWTSIAQLGYALGVDLPDIDRLIAVARTTAAMESAKPEPTHMRNNAALDKDPDWDRLFAGVDLANSDVLRQIYLQLRAFDPPYKHQEFFKQGFQRCGPGNKGEFIQAIAAWPDFGIFKLRDLLDAIPESWIRMISLRRALHEATLAACRNNPEYARRRGWGSLFPHERLVDSNIITDKEIVDAVLEGFTAQIATLDAGGFFLLLDPLASCLTTNEADSVLNFGLDLFENVLRPEDGDGPWHPKLEPPPTCIEALAGYLWAVLGSPIVAKRWEAAHALRNCTELGWASLLSALAIRASGGSATPFIDQGLVFYEWHAQQWLLIGLARGAIEQPASIEPFVEYLTASVKEEHVLVRYFAAKILKALHSEGVVSIEDIAGLDRVNDSPFPVTVYSGWHRNSLEIKASEDTTLTDNEKYYFGIDIGPYWFAPLGRAFGLSDDFVKRLAYQALRDRMGVEPNHKREDARYTRKIFRDLNTSHSHGSLPHVDDLQAYNSYHAMMIVAAKLLGTYPVGRNEGDAQNDFEEWLSKYLLTRDDGRWIADRRDPRLSEEPPIPQSPENKTWCWNVTTEYLDRQLLTDDDLQILWGHWSNGHGDNAETVSINSVLVTRAYAAAILAAAQTASDTESLYLPSQDDSDESGSDAFRLIGWVASRKTPTGIDGYDPWGKNLEYPGPEPAAFIVDALGLTPHEDGRRWTTDSGSILRSETWTHAVGFGQESDAVPGSRLSGNSTFLQELLTVHQQHSLLLSVSVRRRPTRYNSGGEEFEPYPWPYKRYYLIGEDGIARSLKSRD